MKKFAILLLASFIVLSATAQQRLLTWAPEFAADNSSITITVDGNMFLLAGALQLPPQKQRH